MKKKKFILDIEWTDFQFPILFLKEHLFYSDVLKQLTEELIHSSGLLEYIIADYFLNNEWYILA